MNSHVEKHLRWIIFRTYTILPRICKNMRNYTHGACEDLIQNTRHTVMTLLVKKVSTMMHARPLYIFKIKETTCPCTVILHDPVFGSFPFIIVKFCTRYFG